MMLRKLSLPLAVMLLATVPAWATPIDDAVKACDVLTASPFDPDRRAEPPLTLAQINTAAAIEACSAAVKLAPEDGRLHFQLGRAYEASEQFDLAWDAYRKGGELGIPASMRGLARMAYLGLGRPVDMATALEWYKKAADLGLVTAQWEYGLALTSELNKAPDYRLAISYYEKAAAGGALEAMRLLGNIYERASGGIPRDYAKAEQWYVKAAEGGHVPTMVDLGIFYGYAEGKEPEYDKAKLWFEKAVEAGNLDAPHNLALLYENGRGVSKDLLKASELYRTAIERGNGKSMHNLAILLYDAKPPLHDSAEAAFWLYQSALRHEQLSVDTIADDPDYWDADFAKALQELLTKDGFYKGPINSKLDEATILALRSIIVTTD